MKKVILPILITLFLATLVLADKPVVFNGDFKEGATLYSNVYQGVSDIIGKDAYPIRASTKFCTSEQKCVTYAYHYDKICLGWNSRNKCINWKSIKVNDGCSKYKTVQTCTSTYSYPAMCYNPSGTTSNKLELAGNFFYSTDGINWIPMTYGNIYLDNKDIRFMVNIPNNCKPNYNINNIIFID
jgi:hypothetical protein